MSLILIGDKMAKENKNTDGSLLAFILGGIAGSALTLLFAPKSGRELRGEIIDRIEFYQIEASKKRQAMITNAISKRGELLGKAETLFEKVRKFAYGKYDSPLEKIENEISSLKAALRAASSSYKNKNGNGKSSYYKDYRFNDDNLKFKEFEDETLPKHLSMRRRNN